jgi:PPM family protein phosphatase
LQTKSTYTLEERGAAAQVDVGARTDTGLVRHNNEDSYRVLPALNLFLLSDGMGGGAQGETASSMAVEILAAHCEEAQDPSLVLAGEPRADVSAETNRLLSGVHLANRAIHEQAESNPAQHGMGATILAAWLNGERLSLAHVGDSRAYLLRSGSLEQLTADHSLVAEQVRRGILTPQEANASELRSVLTRALGADEEVEVDADEFTLFDHDILLLCSDGLTRMVPDDEIASVLQTAPQAQAAADRLVQRANERGGEDNITVVVVRIGFQSNGWLNRLRRWAENAGGPGSS